MKKVAGSLKLELAQYREVEAFVSFAADLDESTLQTLARGARLVEILKQKQFSPRTVAQQVTLIHAGLSGALDKQPMDKISAISEALLAELATSGLVVVDKAGQLNAANLDAVVKRTLA
jgi:F0F1-type ATP synthase alpha subunit